MIAIDTNILVRLLVNDPKELGQVKAAKSILQNSGQVYLPQILEHLKTHEVFVLQNPDSFNYALTYYSNNNADFADCLILSECKLKYYKLATFDKKLGKLPGVQKVSEEQPYNSRS